MNSCNPYNDGLPNSGSPAYAAPVQKLAIMVNGKAQPGKRDDVRRLFEQHLAPRAASHHAREIVVWCADASDSNAFYLFEVYRDASAMEADALWFGGYIAAVGTLLAGMPETNTAVPGWTKPASP